VNGKTIVALRVVLGVMLVLMVFAQAVFFPLAASDLADAFPEVASLRWPLLALVILVIAAGEIVLVCVWMLLSLVKADAVFSPRSFRYVDVIIAMALLDTVLVTGINAYLLFGLRADPPAIFYGLLALMVLGAATLLLMVVMKGLLRQACALRDELSEVI